MRHLIVNFETNDGIDFTLLPPPNGWPCELSAFFYHDENDIPYCEVWANSPVREKLDTISECDGVSSIARAYQAKIAPESFVSSVEDFHYTFGHPVAAEVDLPEVSVRDRRLDMLREELSEAEVASANGDLHEYADGLIDAIYIAVGGLLEIMPPHAVNRLFWEVHRANMSKLGSDGEVIYREDGKVLKPDDWTPPNVSGALSEWVVGDVV